MPQSLSNVMLHLVFSTKHRKPLLTSEVRKSLYPFMAKVLADEGCGCLRIGGVADHVHVLMQLSRTVTIAKTVEKVKVSSSKLIGPSFGWQSGYGVFSVGAGDRDAVVHYIDTQESHHRKLTFQDEFRALLQEAGIDFDERFVWD